MNRIQNKEKKTISGNGLKGKMRERESDLTELPFTDELCYDIKIFVLHKIEVQRVHHS